MTGKADFTASDAVGQLVRARPARARIFEELGIDYCCGGKISLSEACSKTGADVSAVLGLIARSDAESQGQQGPVDADAMKLATLCDHIEANHHAFLRRELPRLDQITEKVARVHGEKDARLHEVRDAFVAMRDEMTQHMMKEEQILFPMIRQLEQSGSPQSFHCGSISKPIRVMEQEHEQAGNALDIMKKATDGYLAPDWACNTYRVMLDSLRGVELDMHQHVHKENNVLFPKAIALEQRVGSLTTHG